MQDMAMVAATGCCNSSGGAAAHFTFAGCPILAIALSAVVISNCSRQAFDSAVGGILVQGQEGLIGMA
jgi:hypothetical protein